LSKTLILIRHAKTEQPGPGERDYDRRLTHRGEHDAPMMGERLKAAGFVPDCILSSTAKRAEQTARLIGKAVGANEGVFNWQEALYASSPAVMQEQLFALDDAIDTVFLVAHNPGISEFATELAGGLIHTDMPTCGVAGFRIEADRWAELPGATKRQILSDSPKASHE
jgi:phosphohistidine phosphatase